jgi:hypothetical protein
MLQSLLFIRVGMTISVWSNFGHDLPLVASWFLSCVCKSLKCILKFVINLYCPDLIPYLQGQVSQYLVSWHLCLCLNTGGNAGCCAVGLSELYHICVIDIPKRLIIYINARFYINLNFFLFVKHLFTLLL